MGPIRTSRAVCPSSFATSERSNSRALWTSTSAVHYTPAHSAIDVRVAVDGTRWRLVVADDGPGLPADLLQDAFKKFARVRGEPATAGTGLGLAICAAVARLHGGTIEAVNDGGARFTLTLPQPPAPVTGMEDPA